MMSDNEVTSSDVDIDEWHLAGWVRVRTLKVKVV